MKTLGTLLLFCLVSSVAVQALETNAHSLKLSGEIMTMERFKQVVRLAGDSTPLVAQLAQVPFWTNGVVSNVMTYASGKVFKETMSQSARTIGGEYIVFTVQSKYYDQAMNSILVYDEKAAALKSYGIFNDGHGGDILTEGIVKLDGTKKTYSITSEYGGFKETTTGVYTDTEDTAKTVVYRNGGLFMRRETVTRPVTK